MKRSEVDQAVFYFNVDGRLIVIVAHVDDLTVITSSNALMTKVKEELKKEFKLSDMGEIHWILGFAVKQDRERRTISLSQASYIRSIIQQYGFEHVKPVSIPMDPNTRLSSADAPKSVQDHAMMKNRPYREAVGALNYAALGTRPDISYAVGVLSRYLNNPGPTHWDALRRVFAYLSGSAELELTFSGDEVELVGYVDADGSMHKD